MNPDSPVSGPISNLDDPRLYINRELSWLEFNERVLQEGVSEDVPLLERLRFLSIVGSNLDEFFMIRVAGLKQQVEANVAAPDPSGLTPAEQLARISERAHRMAADHAAGVRTTLEALAARGIRVLKPRDLAPRQQTFLSGQFDAEILPVLTPLAVEELQPFPNLPGGRLNLVVRLTVSGEPGESVRTSIVPLPAPLPRFIALPCDDGAHFVLLEDAVAHYIGRLFPGHAVLATAVFRLLRDADLSVHDDDAADLLQVMEKAVQERRRRSVVRLSVSAESDPSLRQWLRDWLETDAQDTYEIPGILDASALMELANRPGFDDLKYAPWPPVPPRDLLGRGDDLWQAVQTRDILLSHPYESFEPVVRLIREAAEDPAVLAIKQTLYRTSGEAPHVAALAQAAERGKQVTVLVELRARFDEARNIAWARRLEDAGCQVIYGIAGYKTHAKMLLIIRREAHGIRRYVHLSTGNYNDRTARLYTDIGLLTAQRDLAADASAFFNLLTGYSQEMGWSRLSIAPTGLRKRIVELIEREAGVSTPDKPGLIMAKINSLQDRGICQALYRAAQAGVRVRLNVRGLCCLRPGVPGVSENIEVVSIVDRFLEHARILYFGNGGHEEVYLSSADWMTRNLDKRLEVLFPVQEPEHKARLTAMLMTFFADTVKARTLRTDGTYARRRGEGPPLRAQEVLYHEAVEKSRAHAQPALEFTPLTRPKGDADD